VAMGMRTMPAGMIGLMVASIFAATTSSMEPGLNKNAGIFVLNFWKPILRKQATDRELLIVGKVASLFFGMAVIVAALALESIQGFGLFDMMMLFSSRVAIPFLIPLIWGIIIKRTPSWAGWTTVVVGLVVSYLGAHLDLDLVRRVLGQATPFTKRELDEVAFLTSLLLNVGVSSLWFCATALFARFNPPEVTRREDVFFERMSRPVVTDPVQTRATDRAQLRTLGILGIPYGGFLILLAAIPNPLSGRVSFVLSGAGIVAISLVLFRASERIPRVSPLDDQEG
jgi:SSS family solute:Na+ symporter